MPPSMVSLLLHRLGAITVRQAFRSSVVQRYSAALLLCSAAWWPGAASALSVDALPPLRLAPSEAALRAPAIPSAAPQTKAAISTISLPPLSAEKSAMQQAGGARQIGVARAVPFTASPAATVAYLTWTRTEMATQTAVLRFEPEGALGVRLGVQLLALPAVAVFRLYSHPGDAPAVETTGAALLERLPIDAASGARMWWTPDVGSAPLLEVVLPADVDPSSLQLAIPQLSHIVEAALPQNEALGTEGDVLKSRSNACAQDVNCQSNLLPERKSILRMVYVVDGNTFGCTGTLINNPQQDRTPYVLTAAHCIHDQTTASTLQSSWFFYSKACNSSELYPGNAERYGGAKWLASSLANDMSLLKLLDTPPPEAVFAGWHAGLVAVGSAITGLHHPRSDMQKINLGVLKEVAACEVDLVNRLLQCAPTGQLGGFYRVTVQSGAIEPGSSGSPLFVGGKVMGTLTGGEAMCPAVETHSIYGRLDQAISGAFYPWLGGILADALPVGQDESPVYRFSNVRSGGHFYTIDGAERDMAIAQLQQILHYEGVVYMARRAPGPGLVAVHRFFNPQLVTHFYTGSDADRAFVQQYLPAWRYEGVAWYAAAQAEAGTVAVYRFYQYSRQVHWYTQDVAQRDARLGDPDFLYDGLAYYVWAAP